MPVRPVLTFDMDGVLCRPPFGINPGTGHGKRRDAPGKRGLLWMTERWRYALRRPMPGATDAFRQFSADFDCHVLSARGEAARPATLRWFERWFGVVPTVNLRPNWHETPAQFKVRMTQELGSVAHFEDDPFTAEWVSERIPVFLVDWRRNRALDASNVHRVRSIGEAVPLLPQVLAEGMGMGESQPS